MWFANTSFFNWIMIYIMYLGPYYWVSKLLLYLILFLIFIPLKKAKPIKLLIILKPTTSLLMLLCTFLSKVASDSVVFHLYSFFAIVALIVNLMIYNEYCTDEGGWHCVGSLYKFFMIINVLTDIVLVSTAVFTLL